MTKQILLIMWLLGAATAAMCADPETDWVEIVALDSGPSGDFRSSADIGKAAWRHLKLQEEKLLAFMAKYPSESRLADAKVRLASVIVAQGAMRPEETRDAEALRWLDIVETDPASSPKQKADAAFGKVSLRMQRSPGVAAREQLLQSAREFAKTYPTDSRVPALLVEVSTVFDAEPARMRALLEEALAMRPGEALKHRIDDDLRRLSLLGSPMRIKAPGIDGSVIDVEKMRGKPVVVLFWAGWSAPSVRQLERVLELYQKLPKGSFGVIAISLDKDRKRVAKAWRELGVNWPVACDGKSWESPLVRGAGINALPTTWILDSQGILRVLNAREDLPARLSEVMKTTPATGL